MLHALRRSNRKRAPWRFAAELSPATRRLIVAITSAVLLTIGLIWLNFGANPVPGQVFLTAATVVAGVGIATRAIQALGMRQISIELLVTIAAIGALFIGEYWEAAAVTFLFTFGAYLEARTLQATRRALSDLLDVVPDVAIVLRNGEPVEVSPWELVAGDHVVVRPGMRLAVDGEVISGESNIDESAITGEPLAAVKREGDTVYAGTVNQTGLLTVRATGVGADTTLARIIQRVEEAQEAKAPTQQFIERFATWYTPGMLGVSIITWAISGDIHLALTLLVISCPGALVISTPVSIVAGIGRAARTGILIKGGEDLERAGRISVVAFDKTGTLTRGTPELTSVIALTEFMPEHDVLHWAASAELASEHPLAAPIVRAAQEHAQPIFPNEFESIVGRGIRAQVAGEHVLVGTRALMRDHSVTLSESALTHWRDIQQRGETAVGVAVGGMLIGLLGIADEIRESTPAALERLRKYGVEHFVMLTGDNAETAAVIAEQAGISEVHANLLPEEKLAHIHRLQAEGHVVAMVGDGINDAPALAAADIGVAMGAAGTDVAIETAAIALMQDDLAKLPEAIRYSRRTLANIRQNTVIALGTVVMLLAGVLMGEVHMAGGMLVHQASVFLVILNAMRLMRA